MVKKTILQLLITMVPEVKPVWQNGLDSKLLDLDILNISNLQNKKFTINIAKIKVI